MKKALLVMLVVSLLLLAGGCIEEIEGLFGPRYNVTMTAGDVLGADAEGRVDLTFHSRNGGIEIATVSGDEYRLEIEMRVQAQTEEAAAKKVEDGLFFDEKPGQITVKVQDDDISARIKMQVPRDYMYVLNLETSNGSITLADLECLGISFETSNGSIKLNRVHSPILRGTASNGNVEVVDFLGETLQIKSSNGRLDVQGTAREFNLETSNGRVELRPDFYTDNSSVNIRTSNSAINLYLPSRYDIGYRLFGRTSNGSLKVNHGGLYAVEDEDYYESHAFSSRSLGVVINLYTSNADINVFEL